jgi:hypothetical protein
MRLTFGSRAALLALIAYEIVEFQEFSPYSRNLSIELSNPTVFKYGLKMLLKFLQLATIPKRVYLGRDADLRGSGKPRLV